VEVLDYIFTQAGPKNKTKKKVKPYKSFVDVATPEEEAKCIGKSEQGDAPFLNLFFSGSIFEKAVIAADAKNFTIMSSIFNAILGYIGFFFVFYIGYKPDIKDFFGFLQESLILEKFEMKPIPIGFTEQMHRLRMIEKKHRAVVEEKLKECKEKEHALENTEGNRGVEVVAAAGDDEPNWQKPAEMH
jgi:hypothetical protein